MEAPAIHKFIWLRMTKKVRNYQVFHNLIYIQSVHWWQSIFLKRALILRNGKDMHKPKVVILKWFREDCCIQDSLQILGNVGWREIYGMKILKRKPNGREENIEESESRTGQQAMDIFGWQHWNQTMATVGWDRWKGRRYNACHTFINGLAVVLPLGKYVHPLCSADWI